MPLAAAEVHYATGVAPLLARRCYGCHGAGQQMSGLRLDRKDAAMRVIQPGNSAASKLIHMVTGAGGKIMPPVGAPLTAPEIAMLRAWIDTGAEWPALPNAAATASTHWSFRKIARPDVPAVRDRAWPRNPIDNFILAKLEAEGVAPSPEEVDQFLRDNRPDAYERVVDRLLASPHFGEKWARCWLDLARYADSDGYERDRSRPWAWRYREWVIDALNRDMPYDEFTIEQLGGDQPEAGRTARQAEPVERRAAAPAAGRDPRDVNNAGRDHHPLAYSLFLAGGGIKGGQVVGKIDDLCMNVVEDKVHVHDLQATLLHCLGLDHTRLTYRHMGRDFRLTDVAGNVVQKMLA